LNWFDQILFFIISLFAYVFSAFAGCGAGFIQLPALILLGLPFSMALATHKVASVALGIGATVRHLKEKSLERKFSLFMLFSGVPGVVIGANLIIHVPERAAEIALGVLTISIGIYSGVKTGFGQAYKPLHRTRGGYLIGGLVLFIIGIINGSLTSGTGLFVTLWLVSWFGLDYKRAVAYTLVLVGLFWNGSGAVMLGMLAAIHWVWLPALLSGSLFGGYIGAHLSIVNRNTLIKRTFEVITLLIGIKLLIG